MTPFNNGRPNTYARGLRIKQHRGVRTIGHDGLWPGYKTSFVRIPDHDAAVICISNDATSDPHDLAFQVVDALIEGKPGVHAVPPMPAADERLPGPISQSRHRRHGRCRNRQRAVESLLPRMASRSPPFPTEDGGLATSRGSADFTMRLTADDDT